VNLIFVIFNFILQQCDFSNLESRLLAKVEVPVNLFERPVLVSEHAARPIETVVFSMKLTTVLRPKFLLLFERNPIIGVVV